MFISEYKLFDKKNRELCNLRKYSDVIKNTFKELAPEVIIGVGKKRYLVISKERFTGEKAREISDELFTYSSLAQWSGFNGDNKRLMERCNELELSNSTIKMLYHIVEEDENNENNEQEAGNQE